jgi:chaperone required for assembly of F1-ATPase
MSEWTAKRFWKQAETVAAEGGFGISLDGRPVKTPAKATLVVPMQSMAQAIAEEWDAQVEKIDPGTMPMTRAANAAIDKVAIQFDEVADMLAAYGDSDLLCYRATDPQELIARQAEQWDPMLDWADATFGVRLTTCAGVIHVPQDVKGQARLAKELQVLTHFQLAAAHDLISLSGSLIIALAVMAKEVPPHEGWRLSRIDEDWQSEKWGDDDDANALAAIKKTAFLDAARFFEMSLT